MKLQRSQLSNTRPGMNISVLNGINAAAYESMALDSPTLQRHYLPAGSKYRLSSDKIWQAFSVQLVSEGVENDLESNSRILQNTSEMKPQFTDCTGTL